MFSDVLVSGVGDLSVGGFSWSTGVSRDDVFGSSVVDDSLLASLFTDVGPSDFLSLAKVGDLTGSSNDVCGGGHFGGFILESPDIVPVVGVLLVQMIVDSSVFLA